MAMGNHCTPSTHRKRLRLHLRRVGLLRPQNRQQSSQTPDIKMLVTAGDAPLTHISLERGPPDAPHRTTSTDPIRSEPETHKQNRCRANWSAYPKFHICDTWDGSSDACWHSLDSLRGWISTIRNCFSRRLPVSCGYVRRCGVTESDSESEYKSGSAEAHGGCVISGQGNCDRLPAPKVVGLGFRG